MTHKSIKQFVRYVIVGIVTNAVGYLVYLLITHLGGTPKITMSTLYIAGATSGYIGLRKWAFEHEGVVIWSLMRFTIAHSIGYSINFILLDKLVDDLGYPHQLVQACAIIIVASVLFILFRYFVFYQKHVEQ